MESYETILQRMIGTYESRTMTKLSDESDIMIRLRVLAGEIFKQQVNEDFILRQLFPATATGEYLDHHAEMRDLERRQATKASGYVLFYAQGDHTQPVVIPQGTIVAANGSSKWYSTDEEAVIPVGDESVLVPITAENAGAGYNTKGGSINIIVTPVAGVTRVYNGSVLNNGRDEEDDESLRARIIDSYKNIPNGTNDAYYKSLALSVEGVVTAGVVGRARGAGTVNVYVFGDGHRVSASTLSAVQELLNRERELNVDVLACHPEEIEVSLLLGITPEDGYSFDEVSERVQGIITEYIDSLGIGRDMLLRDLSELLCRTEGVENFSFVSSQSFDHRISSSQYASSGNIVIRRR